MLEETGFFRPLTLAFQMLWRWLAWLAFAILAVYHWNYIQFAYGTSDGANAAPYARFLWASGTAALVEMLVLLLLARSVPRDQAGNLQRQWPAWIGLIAISWVMRMLIGIGIANINQIIDLPMHSIAFVVFVSSLPLTVLFPITVRLLALAIPVSGPTWTEIYSIIWPRNLHFLFWAVVTFALAKWLELLMHPDPGGRFTNGSLLAISMLAALGSLFLHLVALASAKLLASKVENPPDAFS